MTAAEVCDWYLAEARSGRLLGRSRKPITVERLHEDKQPRHERQNGPGDPLQHRKGRGALAKQHQEGGEDAENAGGEI